MNFSVYWQHADIISQGLYFVLLFMSILTWSVFVLRIKATRQLSRQAVEQLHLAVDALQQRIIKLPYAQRQAAAEQALLQQMSKDKASSENGVAILGSVASIAPFIGLFGTVWGVFHALVAVGTSGQAGLAQVATPVGEALIMTGLGLVVAIPSVLMYNVCIRKNRVFAHQLQHRAHELLIETILQAADSSSTDPVTLQKKPILVAAGADSITSTQYVNGGV